MSCDRQRISAVAVLLVAVAAGFLSPVEGVLESRRSKCERITIPLCQDMPYNLTRMPNLMGQTDQSSAAIQVHEFVPLVEIGCSKHLKFFLCSLYAPMCTEQVDVPIPSCQSVCEDVKTKCLPLMTRFNFNWPQALNCSKLPNPEKNGLCMDYPPVEDRELNHEKNTEWGNVQDMYHQRSFSAPSAAPSWKTRGHDPSMTSTTADRSLQDRRECPKTLVNVPGRGQGHCAPRCGWDFYFTREDKNFAEIWMEIWAAVCFMATLFTVATFWIDSSRFRYPERPIIFLSMCCCFSSVAYLLRIFAGSDFVSCDRSDGIDPHLVVEGLESSGCIVVFLLLYYFGMAAALWWLILTLAWYLAASKQWGHEAIEAMASYFHLVAWAVPGLLSIVALALRHVDGDELTGLCFVGNQNEEALLGFVIVPLSIILSVGALLILMGFVSLLRIRSIMKRGGRNTNKLERLMVRIGLFSVLSTVPAVTLLACLWYEYHQRPLWKEQAVLASLECLIRRGTTPCRLQDSIPMEEVFMLKIFMSLLVGITTGVWVWSNKTWSTWGKLCTSMFGKKTRRQVKGVAYPSTQFYHVPLASSVKNGSLPRKSLSHATRV